MGRAKFMRSPGTPLDGVAGWGVCVCVWRGGAEKLQDKNKVPSLKSSRSNKEPW